MRRRGLFEGSILDSALNDEPGPCPPVERLRHPTHWATYRSAASAPAALQNAVVKMPDAGTRSGPGKVGGVFARRQATQLFQATTGTVLVTLMASTFFYWQRSHGPVLPNLTAAPTATSSVLARKGPSSSVILAKGPMARAALPAPVFTEDEDATLRRSVSAPAPVPPAVQAAVQPVMPSRESTSVAALPSIAHDDAALQSPEHGPANLAAVSEAAQPVPVAAARMMRASFAPPPVLAPAEPGSVRVAARTPRPAPAQIARQPALRTPTHLAAARPTLPRWLTEPRRTPLIMSEPPHDLAAPAGAVSAQALPTPKLPPLREVLRPATGIAAPRWYGGPVYQPYGRTMYGSPYGPVPGPYGAPSAPPDDVTID